MKFLSLLLSFIMTFTALPLQSLMNRGQDTQTNTEAVIENDDVTLEGGGGIGGLLTESIQQSQQKEAAKDEEENVSIENKILDVVMTDNIATVSFNNDKICKIIVAIFDEEGKEMLAHGMLENIEEYAQTADVTIDNGTIPQYYLLRAFLLDENNIALHKSFETNYYTKAHQEFLAKTTDDFEGEEILNLDEDKTNNFAVYNDGVIHITENGENTLLSADDETLTYVFENVNGEVKNLKTGDIVNYNSGDTSLIFKVKTITFDGKTATVTGEEELALDEVFNFMKIDTEYTGEQTEMDMSESDEGVTFNGFIENVQTYGRYSDDLNIKFSFDLDVKIDEGTTSDGTPISFSVGGTLGFALQVHISVALYANNFDIEISYDQTVTKDINFSVEGKALDEDFPIGRLPIPLGTTGLSFVIKFDFVAKAEAKISFFQESRDNIAFSFTSEHGFQNLSKKYPVDPISMEIEGKVLAGVKLSFMLTFLSVVEVGVEGTLGISFEGSIFYNEFSSLNAHPHKCKKCVRVVMEAVGKVDLALNLDFVVKEIGYKFNILDASRPFGEIYISSDVGFGFGECPNVEYNIDVRVIGLDGSPIAGADVNGKLTNDKGIAELTTKKGDLKIKVSKSEYVEKTLNEKISDKETITVILPRIDEMQSGGIFGDIVLDDKIISSGSCGNNLRWTLHESGTLTISGTGGIPTYMGSAYAPWTVASIRSRIKKAVIQNGVKSIGGRAFEYCGNLTSIVIPDSVTFIGEEAFTHCSSLTSVTIPDSVTIIGGSAFYGCSSLTSLTLGENVTSIGAHAFRDCSSLTSVTIPDSVTSIGYRTFSSCSSLMSVTIGDSVTSIDGQAFINCSSLTSVTIGDSVTSIGGNAFQYCSSLTSIVIPDSVTSIGDCAFRYCSSLTSIVIPDSVTSIGDYAFDGCSSLKDVYYGGSKEQWNKISIGSDNYPLLNATIHFNSTGPTVYASANAKTLAVREYEVPKMLAESETVIDDPLANIVTKDDLVPGLVYTLIIMKGTEDNYVLTNDSLLYITDAIADENGVATFTHYCNFATTSWVAVVYGGCNHHASDWLTVAEPTFTVKGLKAQYCTKCSETVANEEIDIIPEKMVIESLPEKLTYSYGDTLDLTGLTVEYTYTDGRENVSLSESDYTVYGFDAYAFGVQTILIESGIYKARFDITVDLTVLPESFTDKIEAGTTVESLAELYPDATVYALTADGKKTADGDELLKTGMILQIVQPDGTVNSVNVIVKGDATGDGIVNGKDIIRVKKQISQGNAVEHIEYADINSDGVVNEDDITALMSF